MSLYAISIDIGLGKEDQEVDFITHLKPVKDGLKSYIKECLSASGLHLPQMFLPKSKQSKAHHTND